jgi:ATP-dependent Clp protease ATP-binding subunit ClpA
VRAKPYSIVLLDEVEKAHPDVFNILLQLLEDGRLTDNKGNTISFKNTIVVATSNIGSALIQQQLSEDGTKETNGTEGTSKESEEAFSKQFAQLSTMVTGELRKFFRPELLNRFDDVVIFKPLRRVDMGKIAKLGIAKTAKLLEEQGYHVQTTDGAIAELAKEGYDPSYGARPLRRLIQSSIENPVALLLISKEFVPGDTIKIDYDSAKEAFAFSKGSDSTVAAKVQDEAGVTASSANEETSAPVDANPVSPTSGAGEALAVPESDQPTVTTGQMAAPDFNPSFLKTEANGVLPTSNDLTQSTTAGN